MAKPPKTLPKRALEQVQLGQSFAEYDPMLRNPNVYVHTPALSAASNPSNPHCFFVGRRGTGKTTITRYIESNNPRTVVLRPEIFSPSSSLLELQAFRDANQRPFKSLTSAFRRSLQDEALVAWIANDKTTKSLPSNLKDELEIVQDLDFDLRSIQFIEELVKPLASGQDAEWIRAIKKPKTMAREMRELNSSKLDGSGTILLDAIDESWDGSELAVIYLASLMHACVEINSQESGFRVLMFLRENIFERVRLIDSEFARLETCVVGLDWTEEQLLELVERRINAPLTAKYGLGGETWNLFFENGPESRKLVFDYCQNRPRDILTYTSLALATSHSHKHEQILIEDLQDARRRFSDSRLKDLGDEYQENYPQLALVLSKFYGLGRRWTLSGIQSLLTRILDDSQISEACRTWIYKYSAPELFVRLLYEIGFFGFLVPRHKGNPKVVFRSLGPRDTTPPPVSHSTDISIHPSYWEALDLQDVLIAEFSESEEFGKIGLVSDLPGALNFEQYQEKLKDLAVKIIDTPTGRESASQFEDIVGDVLKLCFFRVLHNIQAESRDADNTVRRDWVASNRGEGGFWEMVRHRYSATQVIFECKNYNDLKADDFHQAKYYMSGQAGRLVIIVFRGDVKNHYYDHISKISTDNGLVLLLNTKDLAVFVRQAINGKVKDAHLHDKHDKMVRAIS